MTRDDISTIMMTSALGGTIGSATASLTDNSDKKGAALGTVLGAAAGIYLCCSGTAPKGDESKLIDEVLSLF